MPNVKRLIYEINSIAGGIQATGNYGGEGQFLASLGIDPEYPLGTLDRPSGAIASPVYQQFSSDHMTSATTPMFITGAKTTTGVFVYGANGSLVTYSDALLAVTEDGIGNLATSSGNGMTDYNDYIYCATNTDIQRFGRLSQTAPAFSGSYWVTSLGQSALTNSTYPGTRTVNYPNHFLYPHNDGYLYILDYDGANGRIHALITSSDGTGGSAEWDVVQLPPGFMPTCAAPYGTDIAIIMTPQGYNSSQKAKMALWDTVRGNKPYRFVEIGEPLATAAVNKNGELIIFAGDLGGGCKVLRYLGGESFEALASVNEGSPPPAGAVDVRGDCLAWGGHVDYPATAAGIFTLGHRSFGMPKFAMHNIARATSTGTFPIVSCLKFLQRTDYPVFGWRTDTPDDYVLNKIGGAGSHASVFQSAPINVGKNFIIRRLKIKLSAAVAATTIITPTIYVDNELASFTAGDAGLLAINSTNYANSERFIDMRDLSINGQHNFYLRLDFTGTDTNSVILPIVFEIEPYD
uniref:Uncharacterized protein n=1 Tax=viral metagenome TaxID=1070528 RepID=A0A6H1ZDX8_9ZZZZ